MSTTQKAKDKGNLAFENGAFKMMDKQSLEMPNKLSPLNPRRNSIKKYKAKSSEMYMDTNSTSTISSANGDVYAIPTKLLYPESEQTLESCLKNDDEKISEFEKQIVQFVKKNIKHKACKNFIPYQNQSQSTICQCNRDLKWHTDKKLPIIDIKDKKIKWDSKKDVRIIEPTCFGTVRFRGFGQEATSSAPYIRVADDCNMETMWQLLHKCWKLKAPKLLISVTGGAKRFFMKSRLKNNFKRGLVNAATTTGAWIITGGTGAGVMKFVGEAVREYMMSSANTDENHIVALGIATWGVIDNREALISDGCGLFPAEYSNDGLDHDKRGVSPLDHNHTHFILVDNGKIKSFGAEINLRCRLEQHISTNIDMGRQQKLNVPVVLLVLEGGVNTLETAASATENQTPVVVIQGSGRAADLIAFAYKTTKIVGNDFETKSFPHNFDKELKERAGYMFDWSRERCQSDIDEKILQCINNIRKILKCRRLLTVFHLDDAESTKEIDQAILYSLLKAKPSPKSQLDLALAWDRCDVARAEIFNAENNKQLQNLTLHDSMFTALVDNKADFVQLFIDNGVDLRKFLTVFRLRELYDNVIDGRAGASGDLLRNLLQNIQHRWSLNCCHHDDWHEDMPDLLHHVGEVLCFLLGDSAKNFYSSSKYIVSANCQINASQTILIGRDTTLILQNAERELFLWAISLNRRTLAQFFWRTGRDHIGAALTAASILRNLSIEANKEEELDLSIDLMNHSAEWEIRAVGTLNECYTRNKIMAHNLLTRVLPEWGECTVFELADSAEMMDLMGHTCCQTKLNRIWKGRMALYTAEWKIWLALFLPIILLPWIKFTTSETNSTGKIQPEKDDEIQKVKKFTSKLYTVSFFDKPGKSINFFKAIKYFYTAPVTKFWYHTLSYIIFLGLFSYVLLTDLKAKKENVKPNKIEYLIWAWSLTLFFEEIRESRLIRGFATRDSTSSLLHRLNAYISNVWNKFDQVAYFLLLISVILRFTLSSEKFMWARIFYCLTLAIFFLRFMSVFFVNKNIGPKVIMIRRMLTDLLFFVAILIVFILAYGIASHALRFPNSKPSWNLIKDVIYLPYWQIYGELFIEQVEAQEGSYNCNPNATIGEDNVCPRKSWLAIVLFAVYMIIVNVLLLNLLIAMFTYTFEKVQENSEKVWRYYRYNLIHEYFDRPTLAPPLIILTHIWRMINYLWHKYHNTIKINTDFRQTLIKEDNNKLAAFERACMENFLLQSHKLNKEKIDAKVSSTSERIEKIIDDLEQIKETIELKSSPTTTTMTVQQNNSNDNTTTTSHMNDTLSSIPDMPARLSIPAVTGGQNYSPQEDIGILNSRITSLQDGIDIQEKKFDKILRLLKYLAKEKISEKTLTENK